ncbi:MAG: hypothetical protein KA436_04575 [Oligoflexales bacterium]|nr:hypothetical protein [Oligoflexales bacterium]
MKKVLIYFLFLSLSFSPIALSQTNSTGSVNCNCPASGECTITLYIRTGTGALPAVLAGTVALLTTMSTAHYRHKSKNLFNELQALMSHSQAPQMQAGAAHAVQMPLPSSRFPGYAN